MLSKSHIPENILHREKELTLLSNSINVVNTFVYGPSGSGKTLLIKKTIAKFNARAFRQDLASFSSGIIRVFQIDLVGNKVEVKNSTYSYKLHFASIL